MKLEKLRVAQKLQNKISTQSSMKFIVILGQCFALLPVNGVSKLKAQDVSFTWKSWKMLFTGCYLATILLIILMGIVYFIRLGFALPQLVEHVFYLSAMGTNVFFVKLARHWPQLMVQWGKVDETMERNYGYPKSLDRKLKITTFFVMFLAIVEYTLSLAFHFTDVLKRDGNVTASCYYQHVFPQMFEQVSYSHGIALLVQCVSILSTFTWTFNDLFIMLLSTMLAVRFRQVTDRLRSHKRHSASTRFWVEIREDYDRLSNLCKLLDDKLSFIVLLSFATNLFFIIAQLFNSIRKITDHVEKVYFFYSFGFLILRTVAVALYAASINDESKEPISILNSVSANTYNLEINRFLLQISFDNVALSGCKLFQVTRGLILNVAGAIVTYELVLIQFNGSSLQSTTDAQ